MRVRLKNINRVTKKLASGRSVTYYYAWKGGPRLEGTPGSPEFHASYNRAVAARRAAPKDRLQSILDKFEASTEFADLAERTRKDYRKLLRIIESEFGDFPIAALEDRRTRGEFLAWRERRSVKSRRQADYAFAVLARTMSWAYNRGLVPLNPCERPGRLYSIVLPAPKTYGPTPTKPPSMRRPRLTCTWRSSWRSGRDSGKATSSG